MKLLVSGAVTRMFCVIGIALLLIAALPQLANAEPILLAATRSFYMGGGGDVVGTTPALPPPIQSPAVVSVDLQWVGAFPGFVPNPCDLGGSVTLLGCNFFLASGQTGSFDFDAANSANFNQIVSALTDGTDDLFVRWIGGGGAGSLESMEFGGLLEGRSVDFIRLVVYDIYAEATLVTTPTGWIYHESSYGLDRWEVWGTGVPLPLPTPEPATLALVGIGLAGLGFSRRKQ